jgi:hypothetical protein
VSIIEGRNGIPRPVGTRATWGRSRTRSTDCSVNYLAEQRPGRQEILVLHTADIRADLPRQDGEAWPDNPLTLATTPWWRAVYPRACGERASSRSLPDD